MLRQNALKDLLLAQTVGQEKNVINYACTAKNLRELERRIDVPSCAPEEGAVGVKTMLDAVAVDAATLFRFLSAHRPTMVPSHNPIAYPKVRVMGSKLKNSLDIIK